MSTDELVIKRLQQQVRMTIEVTSGTIARLEAENRALRAQSAKGPSLSSPSRPRWWPWKQRAA
jgi:hypothetical protein